MQGIKDKITFNDTEDGFTLIEILVVVLIAGILLAIAVPTFISQRKNSVDDAIRQDIKNIVTTVDSIKANNPNATIFIYKNKRVCAAATTSQTSCPATSPSPVVSMNGNYVVSGGASGTSGGAYYVSGWATNGNVYVSNATRLIYSSDARSFNS